MDITNDRQNINDNINLSKTNGKKLSDNFKIDLLSTGPQSNININQENLNINNSNKNSTYCNNEITKCDFQTDRYSFEINSIREGRKSKFSKGNIQKKSNYLEQDFDKIINEVILLNNY